MVRIAAWYLKAPKNLNKDLHLGAVLHSRSDISVKLQALLNLRPSVD
jgi:hypothetical protein